MNRLNPEYSKYWNYALLSLNPNITWEIVQGNPDKDPSNMNRLNPEYSKYYQSLPVLIFKCIHPSLQKDADFYAPALKTKPGLIGQVSPSNIAKMDFSSFDKKTKDRIYKIFSNSKFYKNLSLLEQAIYSRQMLS